METEIYMPQRILAIDDDVNLLQALNGYFAQKNIVVDTLHDPLHALIKIRENSYDCILMDVKMPNQNGLDLLKKLEYRDSNAPIIMMSGQSNTHEVVEALKLGASDFIEKPIDPEKLFILVRSLIDKKNWRKEKLELITQLDTAMKMVGESPVLIETLNKIEICAMTDAKVLILGESGVGKELVAKALHYKSKRSGKPFIKINCAAIPGDLLESELFGHKRGSFTGADRDYEGKIIKADGGTLFLDEIGDLDLHLQAKLLRVLQDFEVDSLGSSKPIKVDIRVITASNKEIEKMVSEGSFRMDLLHRINTVKIFVPPLRSRSEDIPMLARYFLHHFADNYNKRLIDFTPQAINFLCDYKWPGNIRELKNVIENIAIFTNNTIISIEDIYKAMGILVDPTASPDNLSTIEFARNEFERNFILLHLKKNEWKISDAARTLGIDRSALFKKMKKLGINKVSK